MEKNPVYDIPAAEYNIKLAAALKELEEFKMPEWAYFVKTSISRLRPPTDSEFWQKRAASILRSAYIRRVVGVNRLRNRYGGKQNRGMRPEKFKKASGKIIRTILQQAEKAGFMEKVKAIGKRSGRQLTAKGRKFLEEIK